MFLEKKIKAEIVNKIEIFFVNCFGSCLNLLIRIETGKKTNVAIKT